MFGSKIIEETVCELLNEIGFNIFELFDIEAAAMELVVERIIVEECFISIQDVTQEEVRSAMLAYADGSCKCADEIATLKKVAKMP